MNPFKYPWINDITTTPENPPRFRGGKDDYPPRNAALQKAAYPDLAPKLSRKNPAELYRHALITVQSLASWRDIVADERAKKIYAVDVTPLLRFRDDIVIEIRSEPTGSSLHMRSRSRLGTADFGANAARIRRFFEALGVR